MSYDAFDLTGKVAYNWRKRRHWFRFRSRLAAAGADVSIWGTNAAKNAAAEKELQEINPSASSIQCDVSNEEQVEESMSSVVEKYGRIDGCSPTQELVPKTKTVFEHSNEDWFSY